MDNGRGYRQRCPRFIAARALTAAALAGAFFVSSAITLISCQLEIVEPTAIPAAIQSSVTASATTAPAAVETLPVTSGLKIWLKANAIQNYSDGDGVATWSDSSGNGNAATQPSVPKYKTNILNGKPVVRFGTSGQTSALTTPSMTVSDRSVFVVATQIGTGLGQYAYHALLIQNGAPYFQIYAASNIFFYDGQARDSNTAFSGTKLISALSGGTGSTVYINGASVITSATPSSSITAPIIVGGTDPTGAYASLNGDIAEVLVYNAVLSAIDRQSVEDYLNTKYSIFASANPAVNSLAVTGGLKVWLKADAISGLNDGDSVSAWTDSSGSGNSATQPSVPKFKTGILNGKPVVRFGSSGQTSQLTTPSLTLTDRTVLMVTTQIGAPLGSYGYHALILQNASPNYQLYAPSGANIRFYNGATYDTGVLFSGTKLISQVIGSSGMTIYVNGALTISSGSVATSISAPFLIGGYGSGASTLNGDIAEVIIYNSVLSTSDRQAVESFLNSKYNIY